MNLLLAASNKKGWKGYNKDDNIRRQQRKEINIDGQRQVQARCPMVIKKSERIKKGLVIKMTDRLTDHVNCSLDAVKQDVYLR